MIKNKRVSACLIARNEEDNIEDCIKSIYEIVDEIIVLDTGSTDKTKEIAKSFNKVKLFETKWKYDFSIARNECISYADGDWILSIDADQKITEKSKNMLSTLIKTNENIDIYKFKMIHTNKHNPFKEQIKTFLFRNNIGLKYKNKIHEVLDIKSLLKEKNITEIEVIHNNGFSYEELEKQSKNYIIVLEEELKNDNLSISDKSYYYKHLGDEYFLIKKYSKARECYEKSEEIIKVIEKSELKSYLGFINKRKSKLLIKTGMLSLITILSCNPIIKETGNLSKTKLEYNFRIKTDVIDMGSATLTQEGHCPQLLDFSSNNQLIEANGCPENTYSDYDSYVYSPIYSSNGYLQPYYDCRFSKLVCKPFQIDDGGNGDGGNGGGGNPDENKELDLTVSPIIFSTVVEGKSIALGVSAKTDENWEIKLRYSQSGWIGTGKGDKSLSELSTIIGKNTIDGDYHFELSSSLRRDLLINKDVKIDNTKPEIDKNYSIFKQGTKTIFKINVNDKEVNSVKSGINLDRINLELDIPNATISNIEKTKLANGSYDITAEITSSDSPSDLEGSFRKSGRLKLYVEDNAGNSQELLISERCEDIKLNVSTANTLGIFSAKEGGFAKIEINAPKCNWEMIISKTTDNEPVYESKGLGDAKINWDGSGQSDGTYSIKLKSGEKISDASVRIDNTPPKLILELEQKNYTISSTENVFYLRVEDPTINGVTSDVDPSKLPIGEFSSADNGGINKIKIERDITNINRLKVTVPKGFSIQATKDEIEQALIMESSAYTKLKILSENLEIKDRSNNKIKDFNCIVPQQ